MNYEDYNIFELLSNLVSDHLIDNGLYPTLKGHYSIRLLKLNRLTVVFSVGEFLVCGV